MFATMTNPLAVPRHRSLIRSRLTTSLALVLLSVGVSACQQPPTLAGRSATSGTTVGADSDGDQIDRPGRYRVVNGTPQFARNIMLLDTETGRTWVLCETRESNVPTNTNWCAMTMYGTAAIPPRVHSY